MEKKKQKTNEVLHVTSVGIGSNKRLRVTWDNNVSIRLFSTTREIPLEIRLLVKCDSIDLLSQHVNVRVALGIPRLILIRYKYIVKGQQQNYEN